MKQLFSRTSMIMVSLLVSSPAWAQSQQCYSLVQTQVQTGVWNSIESYLRSLSIGNKTTNARIKLTELRAAIVNLQSAKLTLISAFESYLAATPSSPPDMTAITSALEQIDSIKSQLQFLAAGGDLFTAEAAFKDLTTNLNAKRASTLCELKFAASAQDRAAIPLLLDRLKAEVGAISKADDALGAYILRTYGR